MKLSVVIPVHNGAADLQQCLEGLSRSTRPADEVIVVDDASTEDVTGIVASSPHQLLTLDHGPRGPAVARNRGVSASRGDVLVFLDADVVPHPDTLELIERTFQQEPTCDALFGSYDDAPPAPGLASRYRNLLHHFVHQNGKREASTFWAGCGAIRRPAFEAVGGFDENHVGASIEDIEFGMRVRASGRRILLCPEIQVTHLKRWTLRTILKTDIFSRALPWSRLLLADRDAPRVLNVDRRSQFTAALAWLTVLGVVAALIVPALAWLPVVSLGTLLWVQRRALAFFRAHGGWGFTIGAMALYFAYFLYSSGAFACVWLTALLRGRPLGIRPHRALP